MIESLYIARSKIRQDLLALFFTNITKKYYLREIQRMLGYSAGSIRRELLKFQKDKMFTTQHEGNLLYYSLNIRHPLFKELKSIVAKTVGIQGSLTRALVNIKHIETAFIYGSFAAKRETGTSDMDVMIIGTPDMSQVYEKIAESEKRLNREINITVYSPAEYGIRKNARREFIQELARKPKIMLIGDESDL
jgi:predicted nucleotidyltransferase